VLTGPNVILALKIAVATVTVLLAASLIALARGHYRLHGRINLAFMILTLTAVFGLESVIRFYDPKMFEYFDPRTRRLMTIHLCFSIPAAVLIPLMFFTGRSGRGAFHKQLAYLFGICWVGTFVTGIFYLPHTAPGG
jgi:uncharacterized membrane protein YozB (DUF420 family)